MGVKWLDFVCIKIFKSTEFKISNTFLWFIRKNISLISLLPSLEAIIFISFTGHVGVYFHSLKNMPLLLFLDS